MSDTTAGVKLVPVEPTPEMADAGRRAFPKLLRNIMAGTIYRAMIEAAPPALIGIPGAEKGRDDLLSGEGYVYSNEDTGEEYSPNHPIESGECPDATDIRRSTRQEDHLNAELQTEFNRAEAAERKAPAPTSERVQEIIEMLIEVRNQIEYLHGKFKETASGIAVMVMLDDLRHKLQVQP